MTQEPIDAQLESDIGKSTDTRDTEWNRQFYNVYIAPVSQMADSPQAIVDFTLAASKNAAKDEELMYNLM